MDPPPLPPVVAGRSALPAFLAVEAWAGEQTAASRAVAKRTLEDARAEAERIREEGETSLREAVLEGEREALREVESTARDRTSAMRHAVDAWVESGEAQAEGLLAEALTIICGC